MLDVQRQRIRGMRGVRRDGAEERVAVYGERRMGPKRRVNAIDDDDDDDVKKAKV